jgi:DNA replication initiation complex subunit (GINS family)
MKWMLVSIFFLSACMQDNQSPESALKSFVEARIGHVVTRAFVLERVTGKMRQSIENVTDEEFANFADLRNVSRNSFKVLSKSCQQKKCFITYSVSYLTKDKDKTIFNSEVKKIAEVVNEEGKWLIADVSNIKTYHESLEAINP